MRASERASVMPLPAGISAAWNARVFMSSGVVVVGRLSRESGSLDAARSARLFSVSACSSTSLSCRSIPIIRATRLSSLSGRPIQKSRPSGPATSSAKNVPTLLPLIRRTTSPTSQP